MTLWRVFSAAFTNAYEGDYITVARWVYKDRATFLATYGTNAQNVWSVTNSYYLLLINGEHVVRIWTDSPLSCIVDLHPALAKITNLPVRDVPASVLKKTRPLTKRTTIKTKEDAQKLIQDMKLLWP